MRYKKHSFKANRVDVTGDVANVTLPCGAVIVVDAEDVDVVSSIRWHLAKKTTPSRVTYVCAYPRSDNGDRTTLYLAREIMAKYQAVEGAVVDHMDRDTSNNRKANLRVTTLQVNSLNRGVFACNKLGLRGVYAVPTKRQMERYRSTIWLNGRLCDLGYFTDKLEAAEAFDRESVKARGHLILPTSLNFPHRWNEYVSDFSGSLGS